MISDTKFNIVIYKPEIAMNVGNIMRTCACSNMVLHIIRPIGFPLGKDGLFGKNKRSSLDYNCQWYIYDNWDHFLSIKNQNNKYILVAITPHTKLTINHIPYNKNYILVFGRESDGFDDETHGFMDMLCSIPMAHNQRSYNICVSVALTISRWI